MKSTDPAALRLTGEGLVLREWTDDDPPAMAVLFDDPAIAYWTPLASPFDEAAARAYLATARQARADGLRVQLAITTDGGPPLGEILLIRKAADDPAASLGYSVGAAHRGRRLAARALIVMTHYAHHTAGLPRVTLSIEGGNAASVAVAVAGGYHLTDEPLLDVVNKGRSLALQTWAHDRS
ncbi:GNAT family N-acetyltransferase [Streptomyces sp. NPDC059373]